MSLEDFEAAGFKDAAELQRANEPRKTLSRAFVRQQLEMYADVAALYLIDTRSQRHFVAQELGKAIAIELDLDYGD